MPPLVGVGVPVYNGERYLPETLDSLLAQTWEDFVLIIGDNASTDRTGEIAQDYAQRDPRIVYVRHATNIGAARNYHDLFRRAGTRYFRWQAADDLTLPEYTARCVAALDADPGVALAYCRTIDIDGAGRELGPYEDRMHVTDPDPVARFRYVRKTLERCNALYGLMRSEAAARTRMMDSFPGSDAAFMAELAFYGTFVELPDFLFRRRYHADASSAMDSEALKRFQTPWASSAIPVARRWRLLAAHQHSVARAPLRFRTRLALHWEIVRLLYWWRRGLASEVWAKARHGLSALRTGG